MICSHVEAIVWPDSLLRWESSLRWKDYGAPSENATSLLISPSGSNLAICTQSTVFIYNIESNVTLVRSLDVAKELSSRTAERIIWFDDKFIGIASENRKEVLQGAQTISLYTLDCLVWDLSTGERVTTA